MKIIKLSTYVVSLDRNMVNTRYVSDDSLAVDLETTILRLETDNGIVGWGETCTAPSYYLPTLASGARAAIDHVSPLILGSDPTRVNDVMCRIDEAMRGQPPAKSAIEMALWDLAGKVHGVALVDMWGRNRRPSSSGLPPVPTEDRSGHGGRRDCPNNRVGGRPTRRRGVLVRPQPSLVHRARDEDSSRAVLGRCIAPHRTTDPGPTRSTRTAWQSRHD